MLGLHEINAENHRNITVSHDEALAFWSTIMPETLGVWLPIPIPSGQPLFHCTIKVKHSFPMWHMTYGGRDYPPFSPETEAELGKKFWGQSRNQKCPDWATSKTFCILEAARRLPPKLLQKNHNFEELLDEQDTEKRVIESSSFLHIVCCKCPKPYATC